MTFALFCANPSFHSPCLRLKLNPTADEFLILGCDGIWDCLSNDEAVAYVARRIDTHTPTAIGVQMLDEILSVDPRVTQGIGGDNMTVLVVDLQPHKRSYNKKNTASGSTAVDANKAESQ